MENISGISGVADASALAGSQSTSSGGTELDQSSFLTLLTTQMQNQDPLSPMKNEEMVAQLATFSSLEQLMTISAATEANTASITNLANTTMASLVGTHVVAVGDTFPYDGSGDAVDMHYEASGPTNATLNVYDSDGKLVHSNTVALKEGENTVSWDAKNQSGQTVDEGEYRFELKAIGEGEDSVSVEERISGIVDSMDYSTGTPLPTVDGVAVSLGDLLKLTVPSEES